MSRFDRCFHYSECACVRAMTKENMAARVMKITDHNQLVDIARLLLGFDDHARDDAEFQKILSDDAAFEKSCREQMRVDNAMKAPIVRASAYNNSGIRLWQELFPRSNDPRRPVLMRGCKDLMQKEYTSKSAFAMKLAERYLRRIKFVGLTFEDVREMENRLSRRIEDKGFYIHRNRLLDYHYDVGKPRADLGGKIEVPIFRIRTVQSYIYQRDYVTLDEYAELVRIHHKDTAAINEAIKDVLEIERELKLEARAKRYEADSEQRRQQRILANKKKQISKEIALATCEELGLTQNISEKAHALAKEELKNELAN